MRIGGFSDNGAEPLGFLADVRAELIEFERCTSESRIPIGKVRDLLGARVHFRFGVRIFVATKCLSGPAEKYGRRAPSSSSEFALGRGATAYLCCRSAR